MASPFGFPDCGAPRNNRIGSYGDHLRLPASIVDTIDPKNTVVFRRQRPLSSLKAGSARTAFPASNSTIHPAEAVCRSRSILKSENCAPSTASRAGSSSECWRSAVAMADCHCGWRVWARAFPHWTRRRRTSARRARRSLVRMRGASRSGSGRPSDCRTGRGSSTLWCLPGHSDEWPPGAWFMPFAKRTGCCVPGASLWTCGLPRSIGG